PAPVRDLGPLIEPLSQLRPHRAPRELRGIGRLVLENALEQVAHTDKMGCDRRSFNVVGAPILISACPARGAAFPAGSPVLHITPPASDITLAKSGKPMNAQANTPRSYAKLTPGDPAPWFHQRATSNPNYAFDTAAGRYIVLCFFASAGDG